MWNCGVLNAAIFNNERKGRKDGRLHIRRECSGELEKFLLKSVSKLETEFVTCNEAAKDEESTDK
jgi:hypothetical protein